jgi:hypothetical protein
LAFTSILLWALQVAALGQEQSASLPYDGIGLEASAKTSFEQANYRANQRIAQYETALETGDAATIRKAALEVQKDPLAIRQVNAVKNDPFKIRLNQDLTAVQSKTKTIIKQQLAQRYGVSQADVTFFEATNPSEVVKVGQDWDVTAQVKGKDVPLKISQEVAHKAFYEAATGEPAPSAEAAKHFAESQSVEVTNRAHAEAYGGGGRKLAYNQATGAYEIMTEGGEIIVGDKSAPLRDPKQLTQVMEHKSNLGRNNAHSIRQAGEAYIQENGLTGDSARNVRLIAEADAQAWELEQARQYTKQFDRQVRPRIEARGGQIHNQVIKGTEILEQVAEGKISMSEARARLSAMGETPESIIRKGASQIEAAQILGDSPKDILARAKAGKSPQDVFVENVKDSLELKRLERAVAEGKPLEEVGPELTRQSRILAALERIQVADAYLRQSIGIGELSADASGARKALNSAGAKAIGAAAVAGVAYESGSIGYKLSKAKQLYEEAAQATDEEVAMVLLQQAEAMEEEAIRQSVEAGQMVGVMLVFPGAAGAYYTAKGSYGLTRVVLDSSYGKPIDQAIQDGITEVVERVDDLSRIISGELTVADQQYVTVRQKQAAWLDALLRGVIELQPGAEPADLLTLIERYPEETGTIDNPGYLAGVIRKTPSGTAVPARVPESNPPSPGVEPPAVISSQESSVMGTYSCAWTWNGSVYEAKWSNGTKSEFSVSSFDGKSIVASRRDTEGPSKGLTGHYEGTIENNTITGTCKWTFSGWSTPNREGKWTASW